MANARHTHTTGCCLAIVMAPNLSVEIHKPKPREDGELAGVGGMDRATALDPVLALEWTRTVIDFTKRVVAAHIITREQAGMSGVEVGLPSAVEVPGNDGPEGKTALGVKGSTTNTDATP